MKIHACANSGVARIFQQWAKARGREIFLKLVYQNHIFAQIGKNEEKKSLNAKADTRQFQSF